MRQPETKQERTLWEMAKYKEYETILDTPGLAHLFNELIKQALLDEQDAAHIRNFAATLERVRSRMG